MDYYYKEFDKLQDEFHEVMHDYPLFQETIDEIEKNNIQEINELLEKNDEFYLKKAISKFQDLIKYVKDTSANIQSEYSKFDKLAGIWEKKIVNGTDNELNIINNKVKKANELIKSHNINDLVKANNILEELINN